MSFTGKQGWYKAVFWCRQALACAVLLAVLWASVADSDGMRQHELMHFLVALHRLTGWEVDKIVHGIMYCTVCGAFWIALPPKLWRWSSPWWAFLFASVWGLLMEILQWVMWQLDLGTRSFDVMDIVANLMGAGCTAVCAMGVMRLWRRVRGNTLKEQIFLCESDG